MCAHVVPILQLWFRLPVSTWSRRETPSVCECLCTHVNDHLSRLEKIMRPEQPLQQASVFPLVTTCSLNLSLMPSVFPPLRGASKLPFLHFFSLGLYHSSLQSKKLPVMRVWKLFGSRGRVSLQTAAHLFSLRRALSSQSLSYQTTNHPRFRRGPWGTVSCTWTAHTVALGVSCYRTAWHRRAVSCSLFFVSVFDCNKMEMFSPEIDLVSSRVPSAAFHLILEDLNKKRWKLKSKNFN